MDVLAVCAPLWCRLREGDYVVVGRDGLQVGFVGRHISPEGLFGHLTTAMSLCSPEGVVVAFEHSAFLWVEPWAVMESCSCS